MSLFTVAQGVELGVALQKLQGKTVTVEFRTVEFGIVEHCDLDEEEKRRLRELDVPWKRTITGEEDIADFCKRADEMALVIYEECGGRTFYFEGFHVLEEGDEATITFDWGS